jgi:hypothetical protein
MPTTVHRILKIIAFNSNGNLKAVFRLRVWITQQDAFCKDNSKGIGRQAYEVRKQLKDLVRNRRGSVLRDTYETLYEVLHSKL